MPSATQARLGEHEDSIGTDMGHLGILSRDVAVQGTRKIHTLKLMNDGIVKEWVNAEGVVYAVTWHGPGKPDLRNLLGSHFATYQADTARRHGVRSPPKSTRSDLMILSGGHPGSFWGVAWLPQAAPAGFDPNAL